MIKLIKQLFCTHQSITIKTEASCDRLLLIKSLISCDKCGKGFAENPHAECCLVKHIHAQMLHERFIEDYKRIKQSQESIKLND
jgi:hypothetical protein